MLKISVVLSLGSCVAMDCEMVGTGPKGSISNVGRVAVVNHHGHILLDSIVEPLAKVTDYRTKYSGLKPVDFLNGKCSFMCAGWL